MKEVRNLAPFGWYIASYLLRFVEVSSKGNENPKRRFRLLGKHRGSKGSQPWTRLRQGQCHCQKANAPLQGRRRRDQSPVEVRRRHRSSAHLRKAGGRRRS